MVSNGLDVGRERRHLLPCHLFAQALALLVFIFLLPHLPLRAQEATGVILGTVTDTQGAAIPRAKVVVTNVGTGVASTTETDSHGAYRVLDLPIGNYTVSVTYPGFSKTTTGAQSLNINQSLLVNVKMKVGAVTQSVTVSATATQVETQVPTVGGTVTGSPVENLPLNGRNTLQLAFTQPGVVIAANQSGASAGSGDGGSGISIAGGRSDSVAYLLDGGDNNSVSGKNIVFNPNPDTVAEFKILTNNYTAQYGYGGGGIISMVEKSGTNDWHGSAFDYLRNTAFDANSFFNNEAGLPRSVLRRNQYGGTIGGPVIKNHLFFFFGYEGQKQTREQTGQLITVYTPAELNGNFSALPSTLKSGLVSFLQSHPWYQPNATLASEGIIDQAHFDPVAQAYIKAGLLPSTPSGTLQPTGGPTDNFNQYTGHFDYYASKKDRIAVLLGYNGEPTTSPLSFNGPSYTNGSADVPGYAFQNRAVNTFMNLSWTRTISPTKLNVGRIVVQRYYANSSPTDHPPSGATLGVHINSDNYFGPPQISLDDSGLELGFNPNVPRVKADTTFAYSDMFTWIHGNSTWNFGAKLAAVRERSTYTYQSNGAFEFFGGGPQNGTYSGVDLADFLMGLPDAFYEYSKGVNGEQQKQWSAFVNDQWQARRNLTLTMGLRYEYYSPEYDPAGTCFSYIKGRTSNRFINAPPGLVVPGDPGSPSCWYFPDWLDWAPRFGFAWDPTGNGKTSLRGGFGVFYDALSGWMADWNDDVSPWWPGANLYFDTSNVPANAPAQIMSYPYQTAGITDPFPTKLPPRNLDFVGLGYIPFGYGVFFVNPHLRTPYIYQWNVSLQRQLTPTMMAEIGYLGSSTHHEIGWVDENPIDPASITCSGTGTGRSCAGTRIVNEQVGAAATPTGKCQGPCYGPMTYFDGLVHASYNGLLASLTKRTSNMKYIGSTFFTLSYTWSHNLDNGSNWNTPSSSAVTRLLFVNRNAEYGNSDYNIAQRFVLSGGWTLPFDQMWSGGPKRLIGGWTLYPILTVQTGAPIDMSLFGTFVGNPSATGPSGYGDPYNVRPNVLTKGYQTFNPRNVQTLTSGAGQTITGNFFFNPAAFAPAACISTSSCPLGFYGTYRRNSLTGPGRTNLDIALAKEFAVTERLHMAFRAEAFNVFNHAQFFNPGTTRATSPSFGVISQTYDPRILQLALRLMF